MAIWNDIGTFGWNEYFRMPKRFENIDVFLDVFVQQLLTLINYSVVFNTGSFINKHVNGLSNVIFPFLYGIAHNIPMID